MKKNFRHHKIIFGFLVCLFLVLATKRNSFAHKVNIFAYVEGDQVYTESYFPDGRKVEEGTVEVYDSQNNKLLSGTTDKKGLFNFRPPKKDNLKIVIIASMGHKNSYLLSKDELPDTIQEGEYPSQSISDKEILEEDAKISTQGMPISKPEQITGQGIDLQEIKKIIDQSLEQKLKPIMREIAKSKHKEKINFTEIVGGIGYIFGIIGIILYFTKKNV